MYTKPMALNTYLKDHILIGPAALAVPDSYGIEVELEGAQVAMAKADVLAYWAPHADHSLRNYHGQSIEYIFKNPYGIEKTVKAIGVLFDFLNLPTTKVAPSYRTSIHVHLNFACETLRTIYNFITLCLIFDELLVSQNGDHRIGNNFCLRARDAMGQMDTLIKSVELGNEVFNIGQNERYSSINFASLSKFGSIEFRSLECTTDHNRLLHWVNTLAALKSAAKAYNNPIEIISEFSKMGVTDFMYKTLNLYASKYVVVPDYQNMLLNGMRIAQDFAYCSKWLDNEKTKPSGKLSAGKKHIPIAPDGNWLNAHLEQFAQNNIAIQLPDGLGHNFFANQPNPEF